MNPYRSTPNAELARIGFSAGVGEFSAQNVAYTRGMLYFADVDAKIRAATAGRRTLDDVILPLLARRRAGETITREDFVDALFRKLGPSARDNFEAVIVRGERVEPATRAFGPCVERKPEVYQATDGNVAGFTWVRAADVPDSRCRNW